MGKLSISKLLSALLVVVFALAGSPLAQAQGSGPSKDPANRFKASALQPDSTYTLYTAKLAKAAADKSGSKLISVIVKLNVAPLASYKGGVPGYAPTSPAAGGKGRLDPNSAASRNYLGYIAAQMKGFEAGLQAAIPAAQVVNRYSVVVGGESLLVPAGRLADVAKMPGVVDILPDEIEHLDAVDEFSGLSAPPTQDASPIFIGAPTIWNALGGQESAGENIIVGSIDTGVWPEHPSYADPDPSGKPYPAPSGPARPCQFGSAVSGDVPFTCNNKLIGSRRYMATYDALVGLVPGEFNSARDDDGHGTHTSTTAAGNAGVAASIFGVPRGTVSGIAPRAHIMAYKVCGESGCFSSDSAAAIQQGILDGVDVFNFSISGGANPYSDAVELAFLDAYNAGVFPAASAGNSGPAADTTDHRGPWVTTVAASTLNRQFQSTVTVKGANGDLATLRGASVTAGIASYTPVVNAADAPYNDAFCASGTADGAFAGKVVICERGAGIGRAQKGFNVQQRGAVGMLLYNPTPQDVETDNHFLPSVHLDAPAGNSLLAFIAGHSGVTAKFTAGALASAQGDVMAAFSSRGGPGQTLGVSKPDITAPGVQILAGNSPLHVGVAGGPQGELFQSIAGTSMSSPHIAGSAALLLALHPGWTPGQIKSAMMTTAKTKGVVKEDTVTPTNAYDDGSGRVDLTRAGNPGITFDATAADYVAHAADLWNANYPSIYFPVMPGIVTVQRTAHSVVGSTTVWEIGVSAPPDVHITVPEHITVPAGGNTTFSITVDASTVPLGQVRFATLKLSSGSYDLRMPVSLLRQQPVVSLTKSCAPTGVVLNQTTNCSIAMTNNSFSTANVSLSDTLPRQLALVSGSVVNATPSGNGLEFNGSLAGQAPPNVSIAPGSSPAGGYLPLSAFGITPISGVGDDTLTNFNVPAFTYAGESWTRLGVGSNGYLVVGGGSGPDISITNQLFPNATRPNNVLAAFWTDLNPAAAGRVRIGTLTDGSDTWIVVDWAGVREFSLPRLASFEIWIGVDGDAHPGQDISYAYGTIQGNGDGGFMSTGAENKFGNRGQNTYYNGSGTLPSNGTQLVVSSTPGVPGETRTVTYQARGVKTGDWLNCAQMSGDLFFGTNTSCVSGSVTR